MLKYVIESRIPLVAIRTRDTVNFGDILKKVTGQSSIKFTGTVAENTVYHVMIAKKNTPSVGDIEALYNKLAAKNSILIIVNPPWIEYPVFDAGEMPVPKGLLSDKLTEVTDDMEATKKLLPTLGGVTIKESVDYSLLTMARDGSLTTGGLVKTRKEWFQDQEGLTLIDPAQPLYIPHPDIKEWMDRERYFFLECPDLRLMPRGLLFDGPPGCGKSAGAKYIASEWGIPLYRIDVGAAKNKYVGESEENMLNILSRLDREEPAIALFDEIEKTFSTSAGYGDSGTTTGMMAQILWWLQEHKSRVICVMTTNDSAKIPKELFREGRIDRTVMFNGLNKVEAKGFLMELAATFDKVLPDPALQGIMNNVGLSLKATSETRVSHAKLTQAVYTWLKQTYKQL